MRGLKPRRLKMKSQQASNKKLIIIAAIIAVLVVIIAVSAILISQGAKADAYGKEVKAIYLVSAPDKIQYYLGEEADYAGLEIQVVRNNGESEIIKYSSYNANLFEFSGFSTGLTTDRQKVTVKYAGSTCAFNISVIEWQKPTPVLAGISIHTMPKTVYSISAGDWLDVSGGMILKEYTDGSTALDVILYQQVVGWNEAYEQGVGTYTLTIEFVEKGVLKTTTFEITIVE